MLIYCLNYLEDLIMISFDYLRYNDGVFELFLILLCF